MAGTQVVRFGIVSPQFSIDFRLNGTWRQEGSQLIRTLMGCECADLSSRVGQFCRLSRERLDPRARKRDRRLNMPIKQSVYRLADEPRATILVACSKCDWKAAYGRSELIASHGAEYPLPSLLNELAKPGCTRLGNQWDHCGVYYVEPIGTLRQTTRE